MRSGKKIPTWRDVTRPWRPHEETIRRVQEVLARQQIPPNGVAYVNACLENGPAREVQNNRGNVKVTYTSRKFGHQIELESYRGEGVYASQLDQDENDDIVFYLTQPQTVRLALSNEAGRITARPNYTPDFLVVTNKMLFVRECRDLQSITKQYDKNPYQYYPAEENGEGIYRRNWHYRAADEYFGELGIQHLMISNDALPKTEVQNWRFLWDFVSAPDVDDGITGRLRDHLRTRRVAKFSDLIGTMMFKADHIFQAVVTQLVYVNLSEQRLWDTENLMIYADKPTYDIYRLKEIGEVDRPLPVPAQLWISSGAKIEYEGKIFTVQFSNEREVVLQDEIGITETKSLDALRRLHDAGVVKADGLPQHPDALQAADFPMEKLQKALRKREALRNPETSAWGRTQMDEFRRRAGPHADPMSQVLALVDEDRKKGNRLPRYKGLAMDLAKKAIKIHYNVPEVPTIASCYVEYLNFCDASIEKNGLPIGPMSYNCFRLLCHALVDVKVREGKKIAHKQKAIVSPLENDFPVHGVRPFEVLHCDHTPLPIMTISPNKVLLGKPQLTVLRDANTTKTLSSVLSYFEPSAMLVLLALRDLVRRHNRLPRVLVVDNGSEFHSHELKFFCDLFGIDLHHRPKGEPRAGAPVERSFSSVQEEEIRQMKGNSIPLMNAREIGADVNPEGRAAWTLTALSGAIEVYWERKHNTISRTLGVTPNEYERRQTLSTGSRDHTFVKYDENIILLTCPHPHVKMHKIVRGRGVYMDGMYYQHPAFKEVTPNQHVDVEVRVEPWLHRIIYVFFGNRWITAVASNARWLANKSRKEVEIAIRREKSVAASEGQRDSFKQKKLASLTAVRSPEVFDPRLRLQFAEMNHLFDKLLMTPASYLVPVGDKAAYEEERADTVSMAARTSNLADEEQKADAEANPIAADDLTPSQSDGNNHSQVDTAQTSAMPEPDAATQKNSAQITTASQPPISLKGTSRGSLFGFRTI